MPSLGPAPEHLLVFSWYLPHQAWLKSQELDYYDCDEAEASRADLRGANLSWANLRRANLRGADLSRADLSHANLSRADLSGADLRGAINNDESIPVIADIHKQVYEAASKPDCLYMSTWHHSCGTAHCRAGWVVTLAGEAGKALEDKYGPSYAATLIYLKSDPTLEKVPDFY